MRTFSNLYSKNFFEIFILSMIWLQAENPEPAEQWNLEELTWERMLGLDGSFVFLEHVFWVISLNSLFIFIFAYLPYHLGTGLFQNFRFGQKVSESHIDGIVSTITGTLIISFNRSRFYQYLWNSFIIIFRIYSFRICGSFISYDFLIDEYGKIKSVCKDLLHVHKGLFFSYFDRVKILFWRLQYFRCTIISNFLFFIFERFQFFEISKFSFVEFKSSFYNGFGALLFLLPAERQYCTFFGAI